MTFRTWVDGLLVGVNDFVIPILVGLALIAFLWGIVKYFFIHGESEEGRKEGRDFALWGILGMVLIFSVWGLINVLVRVLGFVS